MKYVLFVCTHNAGRSQIAQAFFEQYAPDDVRAESAGDQPADAVWPNVVAAMAEVGIDIAKRRPKKLDLEAKVKELIGTRLDAIRNDGTAHSMRLQRLLPSLIEDFGAEKPAEEIRACADLMLQPFDDAPVRSFVLTLARRNAQECLREGRGAGLV